MKQFYCRACKITTTSGEGTIPQGWYSISRAWRTARNGYARLGIFCSVECLLDYGAIMKEDAKLIDDPRMAVPG